MRARLTTFAGMFSNVALIVAERVIDDPTRIWRNYAGRTRTLTSGDLGVLTEGEVARTRIIASRISRDQCERLLRIAADAPWGCVSAEADLADADPARRDGLLTKPPHCTGISLLRTRQGWGQPVTGSQHDMRKLKGSAVETILEKAGGVFGDKGFIGTDYITTPIRKPQCRQLLPWEHEWNKQVSSYRAPVERAVATSKTWRILFTDYRRPLKTFKSSFRAAIGLYFFKESFA
jgi:hypothetical protein